jgi:hypothetical protein
MENLGRGLVAVNTGGSNVFVSWRVLGPTPRPRRSTSIGTGPSQRLAPHRLELHRYAGSTSAVYSVRPVVVERTAAVPQITSVWSNLIGPSISSNPRAGKPDSVT